MSEILGNIHSIESCGTVDGPGIRFVVFTQGCPLRCQYCHNPDTWDYVGEAKKMSADEILDQYHGVKEFCGGGITVTGGEPWVQIDFVTDLFKKARAEGVHTALDTSGLLFNKDNTTKIDELLKYTSLVLLDNKKPMWVRHVTVPGITMNEEYLTRLGEFLGTLNNVAALDVLPYHDMAVPKYENLGIEYPLKDVPPLTHEQAMEARNIILKAFKRVKG